MQNRSSKCSGCLRSEAVSEVPPSTSALIDRIISCIEGLLCPRPTISKACTMGTPADIMVASNDPVSPNLAVPATMNVTGAPDIVVTPLAIDFGDVCLNTDIHEEVSHGEKEEAT